MSSFSTYKRKVYQYIKVYNILLCLMLSTIVMISILFISDSKRGDFVINNHQKVITSDKDLDQQSQIIEVRYDSLCTLILKVLKLRRESFTCDCNNNKSDKLSITLHEGSINIVSSIFFNEKLFTSEKYRGILQQQDIEIIGDSIIRFPVYKKNNTIAVKVPSETLYNLVKEVVTK